ncbi:HU family DNA-binding protein [bacterium]|nr:MAG: HU family DNA-binding protein [bacterium]
MKKDGLVDAVAQKINSTKTAVEEVIDTAIETIVAELSKGGEVNITGFGKFSVSARAARDGINPQSGAKIRIAATTVPKFKAGKSLKDAVK